MVLSLAVLAVGPRFGAAQPSSPAARLSAARPDLFPTGSLSDAVAAGEGGARLVAASEAQRRLGLRDGDVVLAIEGRRLADAAWEARDLPDSATITVWRFV